MAHKLSKVKHTEKIPYAKQLNFITYDCRGTFPTIQEKMNWMVEQDAGPFKS